MIGRKSVHHPLTSCCGPPPCNEPQVWGYTFMKALAPGPHHLIRYGTGCMTQRETKSSTSNPIDTTYNKYYSSHGCCTHLTHIYCRHSTSTAPLPTTLVPCSIKQFWPGHVRFLNTGPSLALPSSAGEISFETRLKQNGGNWMWEQLAVDNNDFGWLASATNGTAVTITDGSYNRDMPPNIFGAGWIIYCFWTGKQVMGNFYEVSTSADSYHSELLGLLALHIFLWNVEQHYSLASSPTQIWCDNLGALMATKRPCKQVATGTKQAHVFRSLRPLRCKHKTTHQYFHDLAHHDNLLSWECLSLQAQLNCICNAQAKTAVIGMEKWLHLAQVNKQQTLPFKAVAVFVGGVKQISDVGSDLRFQMGRVKAQEWYNQHENFHPTVFDLVDWPSLDVTLSYKPQIYQIWLSKQASNFCAMGKQLHWIDNRVTSACPNCDMPDECACHLNICPNEGRSQLFQDNVASLQEWLHQPHTHPAIAHFTPGYISGRGMLTFAKFGNLSLDMQDLGRCQDAIG